MTKQKKIFLLIPVTLLILGLSACTQNLRTDKALNREEDKNSAPVVNEEGAGSEKKIGGERDEHGCLGPAGYTWCEAKQKCLREWEEPCSQEEAFNLLAELKEMTGIKFSGINYREVIWDTETGEQKAGGKGFDAVAITDEEFNSIKPFFTGKGFEIDMYNVRAGTIAEATGYKKDNMVCVVAGGVTGYKDAEGQWIPPEPDKKDVEIICAEMKIDDTALWQTYENKEHAYLIKYPENCLNGPLPGYCKQSPPEERPQECRCFLNGTDPNNVMMQTFTGTKSDLNMASVVIFHSTVKEFMPPTGVDLIDWLKETYPHIDIPDEFNTTIGGVRAVKAYTPKSRGAGSAEDIFFMHDNKLFKIYLIDVDNKDNSEFYDQMLSTFQFT